MSTLGTDTTLAVRFDSPLRTFDFMIQENLVEELAHIGVKLCMCNSRLTDTITVANRDGSGLDTLLLMAMTESMLVRCKYRQLMYH